MDYFSYSHVPYDFIENLVRDLALFIKEQRIPYFKQLYQDATNLLNQDHIGYEERDFIPHFVHRHHVYTGVSGEIISQLSSKPLIYGHEELFTALKYSKNTSKN